MAYDQAVKKRDGIADANIGTNLILKLGSAGRDHVVQATANDVPAAVSPSGIHDRDSAPYAAQAGDQFEVYYGGFIKVKSGAAVPIGDYVKSDGDGKAIPILTTAGSVPQNHLGIAMSAAANANEIFTVQIEIGVRSAGT